MKMTSPAILSNAAHRPGLVVGAIAEFASSIFVRQEGGAKGTAPSGISYFPTPWIAVDRCQGVRVR